MCLATPTRSTDLQSTVSPIFNRHGVDKIATFASHDDLQNAILRYSVARPSHNQSFGVRREAKRHAALAALTNIPKAVSRFACHRTPKSSWSATIFADTYRLQICATADRHF